MVALYVAGETIITNGLGDNGFFFVAELVASVRASVA
jgi:hypothetical protein